MTNAPALTFNRWDELFPQLKTFYEANGHSRVPTSQKTDLARFVTHIRCVYRAEKQTMIKAKEEAAAAANGKEATATAKEGDTGAEEVTETVKEENSKDKSEENQESAVSQPESVHPDFSKNKLLTPERMEALLSIGFEFQLWTVEPNQWEQRFCELLAYKKEHGHFHVTTRQNATLSSWCKTQRQRYKNTIAIYQGLYGAELTCPQKKAKELYEKAKEKAGSLSKKKSSDGKLQYVPNAFDVGEAKNIMDTDRICKLNAVGFEWELQRDTYLESWENRYNELLKFKVVNGHCRVPKSSGDNPQLGQWVKQQRKYYSWKENGKPYPTTFTDERISRLNELCFEWRLKETPLKPGTNLEGTSAMDINSTEETLTTEVNGNVTEVSAATTASEGPLAIDGNPLHQFQQPVVALQSMPQTFTL